MLDWIQDQYRISTEPGRTELYIPAARAEDNATFQCTAANASGSATNRARLVVHGTNRFL